MMKEETKTEPKPETDKGRITEVILRKGFFYRLCHREPKSKELPGVILFQGQKLFLDESTAKYDQTFYFADRHVTELTVTYRSK